MFEKRRAAKHLAAERVQRDGDLERFVKTLVAPDGSISESDEARFLAYLGEQGYADADGSVASTSLPPDVVRTYSLGLAAAGRFSEATTTLLLKKDEIAYDEWPAELLKEVTKREFQGGSRGVSVPLGHGIRYRTGAMRGHMVTIGTEWQTADAGMLTVTNQRVVYHGGRKTLEFAFTKLAALNTYTDAIDLGVTSRQNTSSFRLADPEFVAGMIRAALHASNS